MAPFTAVHSTASRSPRQPVRRRGAIVHHHAGTSFANLRARVLGPPIVSYTAICDHEQLELMLPDDSFRPWSVNNAYWDSAARSVCLNNQSAHGWTVADETVWSAARAIAHWATREGWWPHRDGDPRTWTVIGHGEIRPIHGQSNHTACPGGTPLNLLTARAQQLMAGATAPLEEEMPAGTLILETNGTVWHAPDCGPPVPLHSIDEMNALIATNAVRVVSRNADGTANYIIRPHDNFILSLRRRIAARAIPPAPMLLDVEDHDHPDLTLPAGGDADHLIDQSDLDPDGNDIHPTDTPYPAEDEL